MRVGRQYRDEFALREGGLTCQHSHAKTQQICNHPATLLLSAPCQNHVKLAAPLEPVNRVWGPQA